MPVRRAVREKRLAVTSVASLALAVSGCTGQIDGPSPTRGVRTVSAAGDMAGVGATPVSAPSGGNAPGVTAQELTRLTRAEYRATILQAFGVDPSIELLPEDGRVGAFTSNASMTPDPVQPYMFASEDLATDLVPDILPACEAQSASSCLEEDYRGPFEELYRRVLTQAELDNLSQMLVQLQDDGLPPVEATRTVVASALLSPDFLYRSSPSNAGSDARTRHIAERVSYALWDAPPDQELRLAAEGSAGATGPALEAQAARLTRDEQATHTLARFLGQWLDVDTDLMAEDPAFETSPDFLELLAFVQGALQDDTPVTDFVGGTRGFVHRENVDAYGIDEPKGKSDVTPVDWTIESQRRGLLAQELFSGATRHPDPSRRAIFRGVLVRRSLLCDTIPAPTPDLVALEREVSDRLTDTRCQSCHELIDPVGQAFAAYDMDTDGPVPGAEVIRHDELEGTYPDVGELLVAVANSRAFAECFSEHWLSFFLEVPPAEVDAGWKSSLADSVQAGASLGSIVEQTVRELSARLISQTPWCAGE